MCEDTTIVTPLSIFDVDSMSKMNLWEGLQVQIRYDQWPKHM
jgi:hypothetical protein